jgi:serine/threonine protein kinase
VFYNPPYTPGYSAPEISSQPPDARADVFSLGAVLYTMLAGYTWRRDIEAGRYLGGDRPLDPDLEGILLRAIDQEPEHRYSSIEEFQVSLAAYLEGIWPGRRNAGWT